MKCESPFDVRSSVIHQVCGSDGKSYKACDVDNRGEKPFISNLEYLMATLYGKSVNVVQVEHNFACLSWEEYREDVFHLFIVSKHQTDSITMIEAIQFSFEFRCSIC